MAKRRTELQQEKPMKDIAPGKADETPKLTINISNSRVLEYIAEHAVDGVFPGYVSEIAVALDKSQSLIQKAMRSLRYAGVVEADRVIVAGQSRNVCRLNWSVEKIHAEIELQRLAHLDTTQRNKAVKLAETTKRVLAYIVEHSVDGVFAGRFLEIAGSFDMSIGAIAKEILHLRTAGVIEAVSVMDGNYRHHHYRLIWSIDKILAETESVKPETVKLEPPEPEPPEPELVTLVHLKAIRRNNMPITDEAAQVLAYMAENTTSDGRFLPRVPDIATALRLSKNKVSIEIKNLKELGVIETERSGEGINWRNVYMVHWPEQSAPKTGSYPERKLIGRKIKGTDTPEKILQSALDFLGAPLKPEHSAAVFALMRKAPNRQPGLRGLEFNGGVV